MLSQGLDLAEVQTSSRVYFPEDLAVLPQMKLLKQGGHVSLEHLLPGRWNLHVLEQCCEKWLVHVRDPRQALLSWAHHCSKYYHSGGIPMIEFYLPSDLEGFFKQSLAEQLDWHIAHYLPLELRFIQAWLEISAQPHYQNRILWTTFEEFVGDNQAFFWRIVDFFGLEQGSLQFPELRREQVGHFRKGEKNEWRTVFSAEQRHRATEMIPLEIRQRFAWE